VFLLYNTDNVAQALDAEALERCTSIYLPDRAIPMLPHEISTNLASLVAGKDRLTLAVDMQLSAQGVVKSFRYIEGLMRCKAESEATYQHMLSVSALMVSLARQMRLPPAETRMAGMAGLLLDIGISRMPRFHASAIDCVASANVRPERNAFVR
jgi:exoribonuclease II